MNKIIRYRDFLNDEELNEIQNIINSSSWSYGHSSNVDGNKFWVIKSLENNEFFSKTLLSKIENLTERKFDIERIYMNGHTFGNHGNIHTDGEREDGRTFMIYCNDFWYPEFGGGTSFLVNGIFETLYPEPRSAVFFASSVPHFSTPLSHSFKDLRVTLAYKLYEL